MNLLIVEDEPVFAEALRTVIEQSDGEPFAVKIVASKKDAVEALTEQRYDGVLLDLCLPDSTGLDTVKAIALAAHGVPIVVFTAESNEQIMQEAIKAGALDYLVKGYIESPLLVRAIRGSIARAQVQRAVAEIERAKCNAEQLHAELKQVYNELGNLISNMKSAQAK
jgi:DNA-binding response OmpR family regulator